MLKITFSVLNLQYLGLYFIFFTSLSFNMIYHMVTFFKRFQFFHLNWLFCSISYFVQKSISFLHKMCDFAQNLLFVVYDLFFTFSNCIFSPARQFFFFFFFFQKTGSLGAETRKEVFFFFFFVISHLVTPLEVILKLCTFIKLDFQIHVFLFCFCFCFLFFPNLVSFFVWFK